MGEKPNGGCKIGKRGKGKMKPAKDKRPIKLTIKKPIKLTIPNKRLGLKKDGTKDRRFKGGRAGNKGKGMDLQQLAVSQNRNPGTGKKNRGRPVGSKNEMTRMKELYK